MIDEILPNLIFAFALAKQFTDLLTPAGTGIRRAHFERRIFTYRTVQITRDGVNLIGTNRNRR